MYFSLMRVYNLTVQHFKDCMEYFAGSFIVVYVFYSILSNLF